MFRCVVSQRQIPYQTYHNHNSARNIFNLCVNSENKNEIKDLNQNFFRTVQFNAYIEPQNKFTTFVDGSI